MGLSNTQQRLLAATFVVCALLLGLLPAGADCRPKCPNDVVPRHLVHYSVHKTGTVFSLKLFQELAKTLPGIATVFSEKEAEQKVAEDHDQIVLFKSGGVSGCKVCHFGTLIIRHPLDMLVSSYKYHQTTTEEWMVGSRHAAKLRESPQSEAMKIELASDHYGRMMSYLNATAVENNNTDTLQKLFVGKYEEVTRNETIAFHFYRSILQEMGYHFNSALEADLMNALAKVMGHSGHHGTVHGPWWDEVSAAHISLFKQRFGATFIEDLGYSLDVPEKWEQFQMENPYEKIGEQGGHHSKK